LRKQIASSGYLKKNYTGVLDHLGVPSPECHIAIEDLPKKYRQEASEGRLKECFIPQAARDKLAGKYPALQPCLCIESFWKSSDGKKLACVAYEFLGPSLLISEDAGATWKGPLFVGLQRLPGAWYAILSDTKLPLISGGKLQIEVTIWKRDWSRPGGPLKGYTYLWKKWHKMLSVPLAVLERDTDGDGLTDLFEERILTNPESDDTDSDGIKDACDNQPLSPFPKRLTESDKIFLALVAGGVNTVSSLFEMIPSEFRKSDVTRSGLRTSLNEAGVAHLTAVSKKPIPIAQTTFVASEVDVLSHITGNRRVIVLNSAARKRYEKKFGPDFLPEFAVLGPLLIDPTKTKGFLKTYHSQRGEALMFVKEGRAWIPRALWRAQYD
jgi:hypothetical protein